MSKIRDLKKHIKEEIAELNKLSGDKRFGLLDKEDLFKEMGHKAGADRAEEPYLKVAIHRAGTTVDRYGNIITS